MVHQEHRTQEIRIAVHLRGVEELGCGCGGFAGCKEGEGGERVKFEEFENHVVAEKGAVGARGFSDDLGVGGDRGDEDGAVVVVPAADDGDVFAEAAFAYEGGGEVGDDAAEGDGCPC